MNWFRRSRDKKIKEEEEKKEDGQYEYPFKTDCGVGVHFQAVIGDQIQGVLGLFTGTKAAANPSIVVVQALRAQEGSAGKFFTIHTKFGAPIIWEELSKFPLEKEVLVPPCEPFRFAKYINDGQFVKNLESLVPFELVHKYLYRMQKLPIKLPACN